MRALKKKSEKRSKIQKLKEKEDQPNVATDGIDIQVSFLMLLKGYLEGFFFSFEYLY